MKQQHRLYRDAQNDYWEARSSRARRVLAARKAAKTALSILGLVVLLGAVAVSVSGKASSIIHRMTAVNAPATRASAKPMARVSAPPTPLPTGSVAPQPSAPAPSPVSDEADVTSTCTTGIYDLSTQTFSPMTAGPSSQQGDSIAEAYQVTLTNSGSSAAEVNGFSVVFYSGGTTETDSDSENVDLRFIEPGQSLTWTEYPWGQFTSGGGESAVGPFTTGTTGALDASATCQLAQWTHP